MSLQVEILEHLLQQAEGSSVPEQEDKPSHLRLRRATVTQLRHTDGRITEEYTEEHSSRLTSRV